MWPASMLTTDANIQHIQQVVYYQRTAIDNLKANLATYPTMERQTLPMRSGKTMQFYVNNVMAAKTTPVSEGTPPAPTTNGSVSGTVTLQQYGDYMTFSDMLDKTAISPIVQEQAEELGFSASRSLDSLNYVQFDTTIDADATAQIDLDASPAPEYFSAEVARRCPASLQAQNVKPKKDGYFAGIMHPLVAFDYVNDNTLGGVLDILKYNDYGRLKSGIVNNQVLTLDGIRWVMSTEVTTEANYGGGGQIGYHSYVLGDNAFLCTSLSFTEVPGEKNFVARVRRYSGDDPSDPLGLVAASAAYTFKYATYVPPDGTTRARRVTCEVSIT